MIIFIKGFTIGLAYLAPIGMQNLFVINSALSQSKKRAYLTALIVIFFDVTLALICFLGIGLLLTKLHILRMAILLIGGGVVAYIGISLLRAKPPSDINKDVNMPIKKIIVSACAVTWFNPQAIIDGSMLLGASRASLVDGGEFLFILGVSIASFTWFFGITSLSMIFHNLFTAKVLRGINIACGIFIILYGLSLIYSFISQIFNLGF